MPYLKLSLYKEHVPFGYSLSHPEQYRMYKEAMSFNGGSAFASEDELIVRKTDGTTFRSPLRHYESDVFTETYVGRFQNGQPFRFLFASDTNPMAKLNPMVTFAGMATDGWAVHFRVRP